MDTRTRQLWLRVAISLVIAIGFGLALVRQIDLVPSDPSLPAWVLPSYLLGLLLYFLLRAGRWHFLVAPLAREQPLRWTTSLAVSMAGIMWIMVLPLRLGELARPYFLARKSEISVTQALGAVALERVVDGLFVCGLFFVVMPLLPEVSGEQAEAVEWLHQVGRLAAFGLLGVLVVLLGMAMAPGTVGRLVEATLGRLIPPLATKLGNLARGIAEGLAALPSPLPLLWFLLATCAYWGVNAAGTWLLARGCGLALGFPEALAIVAVLGLSMLVPGGPGQFGVFQYGLALGLSMFVSEELVRSRGSVFIFWMFVTQLSLGVLLGVIAQRRLKLDWTLRGQFGTPARPPADSP
jgi:uncharacterized membrane protein YbhN (UPF0104 family)